jgi:hypothetical protein
MSLRARARGSALHTLGTFQPRLGAVTSQPGIEVVATHVVAIVAFATLAWLLLRAPVARLRTLVAANSPPPDAEAVLG